MNYGNYGRDLLLEVSRSSKTSASSTEPALTAYNDETVRNCLQDLKLHVTALQDQVEAVSSSGGTSSTDKPSVQVRPSILLQNAAIQRNKRCLLAYHVQRMHRIKRHMYWQQQQEQESTNGSENRKVLCPAEQDWLQQYGKMVDKYTASTGLPTDALRSMQVPPVAQDRVLVRVVNEDAFEGAICLESGAVVVFSQGATHYLMASDVQDYVQAGHLQVLDNGEEDGM